jgi:hypothetical protein
MLTLHIEIYPTPFKPPLFFVQIDKGLEGSDGRNRPAFPVRAFQTYIAGSPSIHWNKKVLMEEKNNLYFDEGGNRKCSIIARCWGIRETSFKQNV